MPGYLVSDLAYQKDFVMKFGIHALKLDNLKWFLCKDIVWNDAGNKISVEEKSFPAKKSPGIFRKYSLENLEISWDFVWKYPDNPE